MKKRRILSILLILLLITVLGCSKTTIPASYIITAENYFDYQDGMQCSGYSSAYALRSMGVKTDGLTLYDKIENKNDDGTVNPDALTAMLEKEGYDADVRYNCTLEDLKKQLLNGVPVVVLIRVNTTGPYLHYDPVVGYDKENIYIAESLTYLVNARSEAHFNRKVSVEEFEQLWDTDVVTNLYISIQEK